ncbi:pirin family protein [Erwinia amylovora]|uniref:Protein yhhW n=4 Tax=Erwinia amylovora TaxID=552 RepID=A0A831ETU2_ERWAM|nr:pirin family protein [Erwinia amylovora]CBX82003.1 Protein yhhW [Erwinia amylovora ATCC BAA-2158]CDK16451.1 Protein yhhW [Erwinia amylovora LA635]CDK19818.1 Protein yhhW [Erwinia amylovora LA636]CDK23189.1 Protein yhhW [Erwinia amylovora LA637]ATZ10431.1 pirin family protein [Erwinia amylovora]
MIDSRTAQQCGTADYGWLQARYTFSFGHYFDPSLLGYASLRVLNQEVLAPGSSLQPRTYPKVDVLNLILQGTAEYRDSEGHYAQAQAGEALLLATQPGVSYSEHNISKEQVLTRMQLWMEACPQLENAQFQRLNIAECQPYTLVASPDGSAGSMQLRQQLWIHQLVLKPGENYRLPLKGPRAYLQSIYGSLTAATPSLQQVTLSCGDGAFLRDEQSVTLVAITPVRALVIDLPL